MLPLNGNLCQFYKQSTISCFPLQVWALLQGWVFPSRVYWQTTANTIYIVSPSNWWGLFLILKRLKGKTDIWEITFSQALWRPLRERVLFFKLHTSPDGWREEGMLRTILELGWVANLWGQAVARSDICCLSPSHQLSTWGAVWCAHSFPLSCQIGWSLGFLLQCSGV